MSLYSYRACSRIYSDVCSFLNANPIVLRRLYVARCTCACIVVLFLYLVVRKLEHIICETLQCPHGDGTGYSPRLCCDLGGRSSSIACAAQTYDQSMPHRNVIFLETLGQLEQPAWTTRQLLSGRLIVFVTTVFALTTDAVAVCCHYIQHNFGRC